MKFTIVTPCWNAAATIRRTIDSIIGQRALSQGSCELQYIIADGGSTDGTVDIARAYNDPRIEIISEKDRGMYDALVKGLRRASGDVVAYLNAGDSYSPTAFGTVRTILTENPSVRWLTGCCCYANEYEEMISFSRPKAYSRLFAEAGLYDGKSFPPIQQESTFWRADLHSALDLDRLAKMRLAGDYYMWTQFARVTDLHTVYTHLASFSYQKGQLSENTAAYDAEIDSVRPQVSRAVKLAAKRDRSPKRGRWAPLAPFLPKPTFGGVYYFDIKNHVWTTKPEAACP